MIRDAMNRRHLIQRMSRAILGVGATALLPNCATTGDGSIQSTGNLPPATKDAPFVNSLGMKFVPVPGTNILMCTTETTVAQYQAAGMGYRAPRYPQGSDHPAVNISWNDAKAWCAWLSKREGRRYRLPMDAEWSAAVGGSKYPWGNQWPPPNNFGNYAGQELRSTTEEERKLFFRGFELIGGFKDRHKFTAPVGSYPANGYGLHDLGGNAWECCEDKLKPEQPWRVVRGGMWLESEREILSSSERDGIMPGDAGIGSGFRCVIA